MQVKCELLGHEHVIEDIMWLNHAGSKEMIVMSEIGQSLFKTNKSESMNDSDIQSKYQQLV